MPKKLLRYFTICLLLTFGKPMHAQISFLWPNASTYNPNTDKYYITCYKGKNVISIDASGNKAEFIKGLNAPNNILYANLPIGAGYIVLDSNQIAGYDDTGGYYGSFTTTGAIKFQDAVFDDVNNILYTTDVNRGVLYKTTFGTAPFYFPSTSVFCAPHRRPSAMVLQLAKNRILFVEDTTGGNLRAVNLTSAAISTVKNLNMDNLVGLAEDGQGNLYISSQGLKAIYQLNKYYAGNPVKLYTEPKPGDLLVNTLKDQWVYSCLICGAVYIPPLHIYGPGLEIAGCAGDSFHCYKNYLMKNIGTFDKGNQFIMELSNKSGQFGVPKELVKISDTLIPATMDGVIPKGMASGTGYRVRWRSTKPATTGSFETFEIYPNPAAVAATSDTVQACSGYKVTLGAGNSRDTQYKYSWSPTAEVDSSKTATTTSLANKNKWIYLKATSSFGCVTKDSAFIKPVSTPSAGNLADTVNACTGKPAVLGGMPLSGINYFWSPGKLLDDSTKANPMLKITAAGKFKLKITANGGCAAKDSQYLKVNANPTFKLSKDSAMLCGHSDNILNSIVPVTKPYSVQWIGVQNDTTIADTRLFNYKDSGFTRVVYTQKTTGCYSEKTFILKIAKPLVFQINYLGKNKYIASMPLPNLKWYRNDTLQSTINDTLDITKSALYKACTTSALGCVSCTANKLLVLETNATKAFDNVNGCKIYPVPANGMLNISCIGNEKMHWELLSVQGQRILCGFGNEVNTEALQAGVYLLKIDKRSALKIVKF